MKRYWIRNAEKLQKHIRVFVLILLGILFLIMIFSFLLSNIVDLLFLMTRTSIASFLLIIAVQNRKRKILAVSLIILSFGILSNMIVVAVNNGYMPVIMDGYPEPVVYERHLFLSNPDDAILPMLGDQISPVYLSPGDIAIFIGGFSLSCHQLYIKRYRVQKVQ
ncbi:MAG: DUF5317 family protein [Candidatus Nealsonbacteria bacterium]|nr:DUF5317 family protein [Candidatus Nealsonbacteria bacterium]